MVNHIWCGTATINNNSPPRRSIPKVPTNVQNILKAIGAAFAFLGSGGCIFSAAVGAANPIGAVVMALGLAAIGIILLASIKRCSPESGSASTSQQNSPTGGLPFTPQPEVINVGFVHQASPPPVFVTAIPPRPVLAAPAAATRSRTDSRPAFFARVPSATSPGMHARLPVATVGAGQVTRVPAVSIPSATSPGMFARLPVATVGAGQVTRGPAVSVAAATSPGMQPAAPTHASPNTRATRDRAHPYARPDRPSPPQNGGHASLRTRRSR